MRSSSTKVNNLKILRNSTRGNKELKFKAHASRGQRTNVNRLMKSVKFKREEKNLFILIELI